MTSDLINKTFLSENELQKLNFVNDSGRYVFRKYYRSGLRSHIFEVLTADDVLKETNGEVIDGIRMFPRAKPKKMFRILRNRFKNREVVLWEIKKYKLLLKFLGSELIAESDEFIVDSPGKETNQIVLCGLQEYIEGELLDPWKISGKDYLWDLFKSNTYENFQLQELVQKAQNSIALLVEKIRHMITETGYIPDLAGVGNLVLSLDGGIKLVDINNIVEIKLDNNILIDNKGYPSCDVSVEVLSILERNILQKDILPYDPLYQLFLSPERRKKVKALEKEFYKKLR